MKIRIDVGQINAAVRDIAKLFEPNSSGTNSVEIIHRLRKLILGDHLKDCIANLGTVTTADDHVIRFGVCGELLEIATAARAFVAKPEATSIRRSEILARDIDVRIRSWTKPDQKASD